MAAKKVSRITAKKLKDKWRAKQWYTIYAPELFDTKEIPATPADDPSKLMGRMVEITMQELTQDFSKSHIKMRFRINRIAGFDAHTEFIGHEFTSDYIRRLTRRRRTKIDGVFDVTTKDGYRIRVKPMAIAEHRIQNSQKGAIRGLMNEVVAGNANQQLMGEFVRGLINGDISRNIFKACKPIYRLKRVDIRRSEIMGRLSTHKAVEEEPQDIDAIPEEETIETDQETVTDEGKEGVEEEEEDTTLRQTLAGEGEEGGMEEGIPTQDAGDEGNVTHEEESEEISKVTDINKESMPAEDEGRDVSSLSQQKTVMKGDIGEATRVSDASSNERENEAGKTAVENAADESKGELTDKPKIEGEGE